MSCVRTNVWLFNTTNTCSHSLNLLLTHTWTLDPKVGSTVCRETTGSAPFVNPPGTRSSSLGIRASDRDWWGWESWFTRPCGSPHLISLHLEGSHSDFCNTFFFLFLEEKEEVWFLLLIHCHSGNLGKLWRSDFRTGRSTVETSWFS